MAKLEEVDFHYKVSYKYDTSSCVCRSDDGGAYDYCRCGRILDPRVEDLRVWEFSKVIADHLKISDPIARYAIERFCSLVARGQIIDLEEAFDIDIKPGYYGEEIGTITLRSHVAQLLKDINWQNDTQAMLGVLELEREPAAEEMHGKEFTVKRIDLEKVISAISVPKKSLKAAVAKARGKDNDDWYKGDYDWNKNLYVKDLCQAKHPIALCVKSGTEYIIVDGNARIASAKDAGIRRVTIVEAK